MPPTSTAAQPVPWGRAIADPLRIALFSRHARQAWAVLLVALVGLVLWQALTPNPQGPSLGWDKANHAAAFAVLAFCAMFALRQVRRPPGTVTVLLTALGVFIEVAQAHVPGRSGEPMDVLADVAGIAIGAVAAGLLARALERRRSRRLRTS